MEPDGGKGVENGGEEGDKGDFGSKMLPRQRTMQRLATCGATCGVPDGCGED